MKWSFLALGSVEVAATDPRGVLVEYQWQAVARNRIRLLPSGETFTAEGTDQPTNRLLRQRGMPAPFVRTSLGKNDRLGWPNGATTLRGRGRVAGWGDRFALVFDEHGFTVIDAEADRVVHLVLPPDAPSLYLGDALASAGHMWIGSRGGVVAIPTAPLESLAAGTVDVTIVRHYPLRNRDAKLACVFLWYLQNGRAMVEIGNGHGGAKEPKLEIAMPKLDIAKYAPVQLVDELYPQVYAGIEISGQRFAITNTSATATHAAKITSARAKDPTAVSKAAPSSLAQTRRSSDEIDRLVAEIVANPNDDAQRAVLADLLLELGDPSAEAIAKLRSGKASAAKLKEALGPLGIYLTKVEHVGGFPAVATIAREAPDADDHPTELDAACADFRLAFIHTLHAQHGRRSAPAIYARLVGAPNATSLRRVDVSDQAAIDALIAANRDQLEYLEYIDLAKAAWMERLATPTFDRVTTVHALVGLAHLQPFVNRLVKDASKFWKRIRRRLVLDETRDRNADLLRALGEVWAKLPIAALSVGGVTIERDGPITGDDAALVLVATLAFSRRR